MIIGDTIHDVACAAAHDCRCLAVCTGGTTEAQLRQAGATTVVPDLADSDAIIDWFVGVEPGVNGGALQS